MRNRLNKFRLVKRIIIILSIMNRLIFDKGYSLVCQPETSLIKMLVIKKSSSPHYECKVIFPPSTFEYRSTNFFKFFHRILIKWTILRYVPGIKKYIVQCHPI